MSCEKSMRTRVVIAALTLRPEDRRNVSGYASELEYFAAETHLVVVPCVIFSSHLSVYHLVRSFAVLLFAFSSRRSHVFPFALHCSISLRSNISNTRKSVSSGYPNTEKWVEKTRRSRVFLTDFEVFGYLMKHSFEFLIWLLKPFIILGEIQSRSSQNFMLIKIRYPNHRHGSDFLCFLFMNY